MAANLSTYDGALKNVYAPKADSVLNTMTPLLDAFKQGKGIKFDGRQFVFSVLLRRNQRVGARAAGSTSLPTAPNQEHQGYNEASEKPKRNWGVIKILQEIIDQSKTDEGAFTRVATSEVQGMSEAMAWDIDRQYNSDGSGVLANCTAQTSVTTLTVTKYNGLPFPFEVGMSVDILTRSSGAVVASARNITAIDEAALTITIDGAAVTTATTDGVYRAGARNNETNGIGNLVKDTGSLHGIDPATAGNERWKASRVHNSGTNRSISELLMAQAYDAPQKARGSGKAPDFIYGSFGVREQWFSLLAALKRFPSTKTLPGGFTSVPFNGVDFLVGTQAAANRVYFLSKGEIQRARTAGSPKWMDDDGTVLKWDGATGYEAVYYTFENLITRARNSASVLEDITE